MNVCSLIGNLTKDPELRQTNNGNSVCRFTVAVNRRYKKEDGQQETDFITCVAWRQQAEFVAKYFHKGMKIAVVGSIRTSNYEDKNGQKRYVVEVECTEVDFVERKLQSSGGAGNASGAQNNGGYPPQYAPNTQNAGGAPQQATGSAKQSDMYSPENFEELDDAELPF